MCYKIFRITALLVMSLHFNRGKQVCRKYLYNIYNMNENGVRRSVRYSIIFGWVGCEPNFLYKLLILMCTVPPVYKHLVHLRNNTILSLTYLLTFTHFLYFTCIYTLTCILYDYMQHVEHTYTHKNFHYMW